MFLSSPLARFSLFNTTTKKTTITSRPVLGKYLSTQCRKTGKKANIPTLFVSLVWWPFSPIYLARFSLQSPLAQVHHNTSFEPPSPKHINARTCISLSNLTMPPKKQTGVPPKAPAKPTKTTATTKKTTVAATNGRTAKATTTVKNSTSAPTKTKTPEPSKSRKAKTTNGAAAATTAPGPKKRKAAAIDEQEPTPEPKKARVTKPIAAPKPKPKVVINSAPTTRLNVYVCGEGSSGELGLGPAKNSVDVKRPRLNALLHSDQVGVVQVAVGGMHCVALTHDNKVLTWGVNDQGALGRNTAWEGGYKDIDDAKSDSGDDSDDESGLNPYESTPTPIPSESFAEGTIFVEVAAGDSSSFGLTDDGQVYGWGTFRVSFLLLPLRSFLVEGLLLIERSLE